MSFLAWAFGLSALAIGFPLLFHLIRRTPRGRQEFSSLMFLKPSPPRLTRRSRLDNLFLLLLRGLAIILLAIAFMRPFLRDHVAMMGAEVPGRRIAILVDTSASMRSGKNWENAGNEMNRIMKRMESSDDVALFAYDENIQTLVDFESDGGAIPGEKRDMVRAEFSKLAPTWKATDLAGALTWVANNMDAKDEINKNRSALQIIVLSDMQNGSRIDSLQSYQWPKSVRVDIRQVDSGLSTNANVRILRQTNPEEAPGTRVRVSNAAGSKNDQFFVSWVNQDGAIDQNESIPFFVPAGTSRVLRVDRDSKTANSEGLSLAGDENDFDNRFYSIPTERRTMNVIYFGDDEADDANGVLYFLKSALSGDQLRKIEITQVKSTDTLDRTVLDALEAELVFVTRKSDSTLNEWLNRHFSNRGRAFFVASEKEVLGSFNGIFGELDVQPVSNVNRSRDDYVLLADIRFSHPLFAPFANPRYNDFTRIHFWKHLRILDSSPALQSDSIRILAAYDDRSPALMQKSVANGQAFLLTSGWQPDQSELALSTKFVPLMNLLLQQASRRPKIAESCTVGQTFVLPQFDRPLPIAVTRPDGRRENLSSDIREYKNTDMPGIYTIQSGNQQFPFAVNLAASESDTSEMPLEKLQMHQVLLGEQTSRSTRLEQMQLLKDKELENRQKIWKWLAIAAAVFLILETLFAGMAARRATGEPVAPDSLSSGVANA